MVAASIRRKSRAGLGTGVGEKVVVVLGLVPAVGIVNSAGLGKIRI